MGTPERRRGGRRRMEGRVEVLGPDGLEVTVGRARDIGSHGMAIYADQPLPTGDRVTLRFELPTSSWCLELEARIVRQLDEPGTHAVAVEFVDAPEWAAAEVARFVARASGRMDALKLPPNRS